MTLPKVAFIGTGGTIASIGIGPLDIQDYGAAGNVMQADAILARFPETSAVADVFAVPYRNVPSPQIGFADWKILCETCSRLEREHPDLAGIVIGHGTATLEETAYFLNLTLRTRIPVVIVGAQRPASALSTDAGLNLVNAIRVAADPASRGLGVLVVLNDEIHPARDVTKTSTARMQTFRAADFGAIGHVDTDMVAYYRHPLRRHAPDTEFDIAGLAALPRVDIALSHTDADGTAIRAFMGAGARGIISAGFAPGMGTPAETEALREAVAAGIIVVQSTRAGSGRVFPGTRLREFGFLVADNLLPQKARLLLALALTRTSDPAEVQKLFQTY